MNLKRASLSVCLLTSACATTAAEARPCTLPIEVALEATPRLNPDVDGTPLPTVVRLYQLTALERIEQADFQLLWEHPADALERDLLASRELTLFPGRSQRVPIALRPDIRFLAAMAVVREPTGSQWRALLPLPESARLCAAYAERGTPSPAITFQFDGYRAEGRSSLLAPHERAPLPHDVAPEAKR